MQAESPDNLKYSLTRPVNVIKIISGYLLSRLSRRVYAWGTPLSISIEPTNQCNLHCPECPSGSFQLTRRRGNIRPELFEKIIDQLAGNLYYLNLYFQGEPFLNSDLFHLINYAKSRKIYVSTSTNGHFITPENANLIIRSGLDKIIISIDGTDQDTYETYRNGGSFERVAEGVRELVRQKKQGFITKPVIEIQFIVFKHNQHQIPHIKRLGRDWGVDRVEIKTAQFNNFQTGNPLMPEDGKYSRYKLVGNNGSAVYKIKNRLPDHCWRMWSSCVFTWEGDVVPCCYDKDATFNMGNIKFHHFHKIWKGRSYEHFRQQVLSGRKEIGICRNCDQKF